MNIFVTGATGWVGSAVVTELLASQHRVLGLVRSEAGAKRLTELGAEALVGSLDDLDSLRRGAARADGVIHTAFNHDFSRFAENCEQDRRAIEALGAALKGSDRPLVVTSGMLSLAKGRPVMESDLSVPPSPSYPRASEAAAQALAEQGVRAAVVRLPPTVHGHGDHAFVPRLIDIARQTGSSAYVGDGQNRWSAVHRLDAARVFRLAVERAAPGATYHAAAEEGVAFRQIAEVIARRLEVPLAALSAEEAAAHFGWLAPFASRDLAASSERTRSILGWEPQQPRLLADIDHPAYFSMQV